MSHKELNPKFSAQKSADAETGKRYFIRLNLSERVQHFILFGCFIVLAVTGFMVMIPEVLAQALGGASETVFFYRGLLHRIAGIILISVGLFHFMYLLFTRAGRRWLVDMLPRPRDLKDMIFNIFYYLGLKKEPPEFDRFSYKQKFEYGALIAGSTIMSATGLLLWTEYRWSKFILDIAKLVHGMEAILACLAIIIWHLFEVYLLPHQSSISKTWITGLIDEDEMKEEFAGHYKKIMADPALRQIYVHGENAADQAADTPQPVKISDLSRIH
jgi:cytochrome b subunit of formate dehydrogenase